VRRTRLLEVFDVLANGEEVAHVNTLLAALPNLPADIAAAVEPPLRSTDRHMFAFDEFFELVSSYLAVSPPGGPLAFLRGPPKVCLP